MSLFVCVFLSSRVVVCCVCLVPAESSSHDGFPETSTAKAAVQPTRRLAPLLRQTCGSDGASASSHRASQTDLGSKRRGLKQMLCFHRVALFYCSFGLVIGPRGVKGEGPGPRCRPRHKYPSQMCANETVWGQIDISLE